MKLDVSQGQKEVAKGEKAMVPINIHLFARAQFEFRIKYAQVIDIDMVGTCGSKQAKEPNNYELCTLYSQYIR